MTAHTGNPEPATGAPAQSTRIVYNDSIVRQFTFASAGWGIVGMLVGVIVALQLSFWPANVHPWLSFGRLRPLHTNAVIFAFVGNMMFAGIYYSTQRLLKARMGHDLLSKAHFWGWQLIVVAAAITLPLGITTGKEYAELEWPIDIAIAVVWVIFAVNFFWTLAKRNEQQLYVALWFYIATILTVAVLHIVNSIAIPVSFLKSYPVYGGVQDALVQWWYGHNAVAFFLTTPILGIMYYFMPKAAGRPVFSYRLSIIHFWGLVFLYIWAGPHHLLYTALPDWAQTLGMLFSVMLWAPSWGGMVNGLLTLRGVWDKLRDDPVLKFFAAGVTFYGMATFEGPLLSVKVVNSLAHYTDWIVGHVHEGALGWNGFMAAGVFYWMVPRLYGTELHSRRAANAHFYIGTVGIMFYVIAMWWAGIKQGLMWRDVTPDGGLKYPNFVETVIALMPLYWLRLLGGTLYLVGFIVMLWNLIMTARRGKAVDGEAEVVREASPRPEASGWRLVFGAPVVLSIIVSALLAFLAFASSAASIMMATFAFATALGGILALRFAKREGQPTWHGLLERRALPFTTLTVAAVLVGGVAEIIPLLVSTANAEKTAEGHAPYAPLELEGRDVYLAEGCYTCHSQMIRPFVWETARYGAVSTPKESIYDHPFQWGSKRTGPDLAREGNLRSHVWHWEHMKDPRAITPGSIMPAYAHLAEERVAFEGVAAKLRAMRSVGVPYTAARVQGAASEARAHGEAIVSELRASGIEANADSKMVALIAYLQRLGQATTVSKPGAHAAASATQALPATTVGPTTEVR